MAPDPCLVKPQKPMVPVKTLDIIFRRRYVPNTQYYFANRGHVVIEETTTTKRLRPFKVPKSNKLLSYVKYSDRKEKAHKYQRNQLHVSQKDNYKIAATRDISRRLFIENPLDDVKAVVSIHPEFYTVIEGRPVRNFDDIKVYISNIRNIAMLRQQVGYRRDLILKLDRNMAEESREQDDIYRKLKHHIKNFQTFLTEDYKKACMTVSEAERIHQQLQVKNSDLLSYITQITLLNNLIFKLDSIRSVLKVYKEYLLFAAPLYWRKEFDERYRPQSLQLEEGAFLTDSGEFATEDEGLMETVDIDRIIANAKDELSGPYHANIYFKYPEQTQYLFRTMELQSREYLIQLSKTHEPYRRLLDRIKKLKASTKQEIEVFQYFVDNINKQIERELYNEVYLEEKFKRILHETFYDTVASPSSLKLRICIEYVYEQVFGKTDTGMVNIHDPMKILEVMYEEYNLNLDGLDFKVVNQARNDCFAQDLKMMQDAHHAQRELREFRDMTNSMNKAFLPPAKFTRPVLGKFVDKKMLALQARAERRKQALYGGEWVKRKAYKISTNDREDLTIFTNWCEGLNPAPYLSDLEKYVKPTFAMRTGSEDQFDVFHIEDE